MPLIQMRTNLPLAKDQQLELMKALSSKTAGLLGKSEAYVMVSLSPETPMLFGGTDEPTALFSLISLGEISAELAKSLSSELSGIAEALLSVPKDRVYCKFVPWKDRHLWGFKGATFG